MKQRFVVDQILVGDAHLRCQNSKISKRFERYIPPILGFIICSQTKYVNENNNINAILRFYHHFMPSHTHVHPLMHVCV